MRIGVKPGQWGWSFQELEASWAAAEDSGFDLLSCFDHVTAAPAGLAAWDAPSLLIAMTARTRRIGLAVHVLNAALRHPLLLASQLAVAQGSSGGRLEVGLGAGSFHLARFDHAATAIPFPSLPERLQRLEACCRILPELWRGETVSDESLGLKRASLGPLGIEPPPIVVGGSSDRVIDVAARHAEGWNAGSQDPDAFVELSRGLDAACLRLGRRAGITRQVQLFARDVEPAGLRSLLHRFEDAGADTAVIVLHEERGPDAVRRLADAIL